MPNNLINGRVGGSAVEFIEIPAINGNLSNSSGDFSDLPNVNQYPAAGAAVSLEAVSSSANDAAAGTGARTIRVVGLNESWAEVSQDVTLNGTTPVALTGTWLRVNHVYVLTAGSGLKAAGNVDVRNVSGAAVFARLTAANRSAVGTFCVPAGKKAFLVDVVAGAGLLTRFVVHANVTPRTRALLPNGIFVPQVEIYTQTGIRFEGPPGLWFPAQADIKIAATAISAGPTFGNATMTLALASA